jgi:hypothetical protein
VIGPLAGVVGTVPGPPDFALLHEGAMPQKDQLCGAFWGSLTLSAAGHPASQEEVALRAGTTLAEGDPAGWLPPGAGPRTDYEATIPVASDGASVGTSATGVARSIEELSGGTLAVVPVAGPWSAGTVVSLVEIAAAQTPGCSAPAKPRRKRPSHGAWARRTSRCATGTTARPTEAVRPVRGEELVGRLHRGQGGAVDHPDPYPSLKRIGTSPLDGTDPKETCERCPRVC